MKYQYFTYDNCTRNLYKQDNTFHVWVYVYDKHVWKPWAQTTTSLNKKTYSARRLTEEEVFLEMV